MFFDKKIQLVMLVRVIYFNIYIVPGGTMKKILFLRFLAAFTLFASYGYAGLEVIETDDGDYEVSPFDPDKPFQDVLDQDLTDDDKQEITMISITDETISDMSVIFTQLPDLEVLYLYRCSVSDISNRGSVHIDPRIYFIDKCSLRGVNWDLVFRENFPATLIIGGSCDVDLYSAMEKARALSNKFGEFESMSSFNGRRFAWMSEVFVGSIGKMLRRLLVFRRPTARLYDHYYDGKIIIRMDCFVDIEFEKEGVVFELNQL